MVLRYATNLKLAKELYDASKPKLKGDQGMINTFTNTFGLPENSVKLAGGVEAAAAGLFAASFLNKNISRLGSLATYKYILNKITAVIPLLILSRNYRFFYVIYQ